MLLIARDSDNDYYLLEEAWEVDEFAIGDFSFFHLYGIVDYAETFKMWLRKFPRPIFIVAVKDKVIISFIYIDAWEEIPYVVNVLRAQETVETKREKKIGFKLFLLGVLLSSDFLITKPLTDRSKQFYQRLGFVDAREIPVFRNYHHLVGYLVLPPDKKMKYIEIAGSYFTQLNL